MSVDHDEQDTRHGQAEVELVLETRRAPALREKLLRELGELEKSLHRFRRVIDAELPPREGVENG